jgi:Ca2+-binding EF-hand superfamily protein
MRFAEMDRDGDGVISRSEWRGTAQSFSVHDWNDDGVLSLEEVQRGARRPAREAAPDDFEGWDREYAFSDWTPRGFTRLDHNGDNRISRAEWHFDCETFNRADHNRDGILTRQEFLGGDDPNEDDDRDDSFWNLDFNNDNRITKDEWHGSRARFDALDTDRNGALTRAEFAGTLEPPPDLFASVDVNNDGNITWDEWHWSRGSFDERDPNRDGRITRNEIARTGGGPTATQTQAHKAGFDRGLADGRRAGRQDFQNRQGWSVEGRPEMQSADAGYDQRMNARVEYQAGYRDGFRRGYREGYGSTATRR